MSIWSRRTHIIYGSILESPRPELIRNSMKQPSKNTTAKPASSWTAGIFLPGLSMEVTSRPTAVYHPTRISKSNQPRQRASGGEQKRRRGRAPDAASRFTRRRNPFLGPRFRQKCERDLDKSPRLPMSATGMTSTYSRSVEYRNTWTIEREKYCTVRHVDGPAGTWVDHTLVGRQIVAVFLPFLWVRSEGRGRG